VPKQKKNGKVQSSFILSNIKIQGENNCSSSLHLCEGSCRLSLRCVMCIRLGLRVGFSGLALGIRLAGLGALHELRAILALGVGVLQGRRLCILLAGRVGLLQGARAHGDDVGGGLVGGLDIGRLGLTGLRVAPLCTDLMRKHSSDSMEPSQRKSGKSTLFANWASLAAGSDWATGCDSGSGVRAMGVVELGRSACSVAMGDGKLSAFSSADSSICTTHSFCTYVLSSKAKKQK